MWVNFMTTKHANWEPTKHLVICSEHFTSEDFERPKLSLTGFEKHMKAVLTGDGLGVTAVPSLFGPKHELQAS